MTITDILRRMTDARRGRRRFDSIEASGRCPECHSPLLTPWRQEQRLQMGGDRHDHVSEMRGVDCLACASHFILTAPGVRRRLRNAMLVPAG